MKKEIMKKCFSMKKVAISMGLILFLNVGNTLQAKAPEGLATTTFAPNKKKSTLLQGPTANGQPLYVVWDESQIEQDPYNPDTYTIYYYVVFYDANGNEVQPDSPVEINYSSGWTSNSNSHTTHKIYCYEARTLIAAVVSSWSGPSFVYSLLPGDY